MKDLMDAVAFVTRKVDELGDSFFAHAAAVWNFAELGCEEFCSSRLLAGVLQDHDFQVRTAVADLPTAFVARWGSGRPVIAFSCEYDALPGLSQQPLELDEVPKRVPVIEGAPGHGCGHNLLGVGDILAAVSAKEWLVKEGRPGTILVFGTPAEEICVGKPFMARAGLFEGVDAVLDWHPWNHNSANYDACNAYFNVKYHFHGCTAHGNSPWTGRSALDSALLMAHAIEMLREHIKPGPPGAANTINYTFSDVGPEYPNVVPDRSTVWVVGRIADSEEMRNIIARVHKCAEGAALATGTNWEMEFMTASHERIPNRTLSAVLHRHFVELGAPEFDSKEQEFARKMQRELGVEEKGITREIFSFEEGHCALCDNSEYSWFAPFAMVWVAAAPAGTAWHNWHVVASAGSSIGKKAMVLASKVLAASCTELFLKPETIEESKREMSQRLDGRIYKTLIPEGVAPPLDINRATMGKFRPFMEERRAKMK